MKGLYLHCLNFDKKSTVIIVCDTDVVTDTHKNRFVSNIKKLALTTNNQVHILVQNLILKMSSHMQQDLKTNHSYIKLIK